jgi:V/A-type H+-transporting ATPase subunit B
MSFSANVGLFDALDKCWEILAKHFEPRETGIRSSLCDQFWPEKE